MDEVKLARINTIRRREGRKPLTHAQAADLINQRRRADDYHRDETLDFLIGYTTGFPMPSTGGIIGAMLHSSSTAAYAEPSVLTPSTNDDITDRGGSFGGAGASSSWESSSSSDSSPSSSSYDSSSSSSDSSSSSSGSSE